MWVELVPGENTEIGEDIFKLLSSANSDFPSIVCVLW